MWLTKSFAMAATTRVRLLLAVLMITAMAGSHFSVYKWGQAKAQQAATEKCQQAQIAGLSEALASFNRLTAAANNASQALSTSISARQQADAATTREIRHALATTASTRIECVFDADIMRQLAAARDRAAAAAAGGIERAVPAADNTGQRQR